LKVITNETMKSIHVYQMIKSWTLCENRVR